MRARMIGAALVALTTSLTAQAPAAGAPATTAAAPAPKGATKAEFRIGGFSFSGERSYDFGGVAKATGSIQGVEVLMRGPGAGIYFRSLSGKFGTQPQVISADARILLFPPVFTVFGGVGRRALSGSLGTKIYEFAMLGVSSTVNIGGSGLRTHISAAAMVAPDKSATGANQVKNPSKGLDTDAALFYRFPKVPLFMTVGYRTEIFTGITGSVEAPEQVRGLRFGGGIQFGGH
jgi:hypothetical protein